MDSSEESFDVFGFFEENSTTPCESKPREVISKPIFEPPICPLVPILQRWAEHCSGSRIVVAPGGPALAAMFAHTWSPTHPEQRDRLTVCVEALDSLRSRFDFGVAVTQAVCPTAEELALAHSPELIAGIHALGLGESKWDSHVLNLTYANVDYDEKSVGEVVREATLAAAGTALQLSRMALRGSVHRGFAMLRPAGHHSGWDRTGPFCALNSVAIAACAAASAFHRVVIIDIDVHYAGGTQDIVLRSGFSSQQLLVIDCFAVLGNESSITAAEAAGHLCIRLPPAVTDQIFLDRFRPALQRLRDMAPELVLVSCGFDAAEGDFEGGKITSQGFGEIIKQICNASGDAPVLLMLEGGYELNALRGAVAASFEALLTN